ncbi:MAG: fimbrillin family protein [Prevotella sp.]|jgi:hypothetical protein|nr:fimbrillin family protein [Prevotella sp.]
MKKIFGLICAILLFVSCSSDDNNPLSSEYKEIRFSSELSLLKSTYQGIQIANGQKVGVFIAEDAVTPATTYTQNLAYTGDGQGNLSGATQYFPDNGNSIRVSAYHPYYEGTDDTYPFFVADDQTDVSAIHASDLLYCPVFVQAPTTGQIILTFKHMLSQINVSLTAGNGNPDLTNAQISIVNAATAIEFNRRDGSLGAVSGIQSVKLGGNVGITVPQTVNTGTKFIKVVLNSGKELFYTLNRNLTLESGKKYTFNMVVNLSDVASAGTDVEDWETGETIDGDASEDLADKLLPAEVTERYYDGSTVLKTVFTYDVLNRVTSVTRYLDKYFGGLHSYICEYEFKYSGDGNKIMGYTSKNYRPIILGGSPVLHRYTNTDFTYEQGSVTIAYEDTESADGGEVGRDDVVTSGTETRSFDENGDLLPDPNGDYTFVYDNKKSPFINLNMEGWLRYYLFINDFEGAGSIYRPLLGISTFIGTHNIVKADRNGESQSLNYTLTYNDKDYMTKKSWLETEENEFHHEVSVQYTGWR